LCLENLFEQITLIDAGWRTYAQGLALLQQHDLVGVFAGKVKFVRDHDYGVAIFGGEAAQCFEQIDLRADVEMERRLVEKE
jgi:hypothetical protein